MLQCPFCSKSGFEQHKLIFGTEDIEYFSIYRTANFVVVPDVAPLIEGHLLIIPKAHYLCYGAALQEHWQEFIELKATITCLLKRVYANCMFFEHGAAQEFRAGNSIDHAHLHCLPVSVDITTSTENERKWKKIDSLLELCTLSAENTAYLFYESASGEKFIHTLKKSKSSLPSQYLRKAFADCLDLKWWDWKDMILNPAYKNTNRDNVFEGIKKIKEGIAAIK
jgi:diadenosine tetraphosphate (Ap4A) HIT family hydrolase